MPDPSPLSEVTTITVADAVAHDMALPATGTVWSQSGFACARKWLPVYEDADLETLQLSVQPVSEEDERIARNLVEREHLVKIWAQKRVSPKPETYETQITELAAFAFQVKDYWIARGRTLSQYTKVSCNRAKVTPYSPKDLAEKQMFVAVVELVFREVTQQ